MTTRIKFNPMTKEVEIEGTEKFVETYFKRIQELLSPPKEIVEKVRAAKPAHIAKKAKKAPAKHPVKKRAKRGDIFNTVVGIIRESDDGVSTGELAKKTGFSEQQVRSVIFNAGKQGVIRRSRRGTYVRAGSVSNLT